MYCVTISEMQEIYTSSLKTQIKKMFKKEMEVCEPSTSKAVVPVQCPLVNWEPLEATQGGAVKHVRIIGFFKKGIKSQFEGSGFIPIGSFGSSQIGNSCGYIAANLVSKMYKAWKDEPWIAVMYYINHQLLTNVDI